MSRRTVSLISAAGLALAACLWVAEPATASMMAAPRGGGGGGGRGGGGSWRGGGGTAWRSGGGTAWRGGGGTAWRGGNWNGNGWRGGYYYPWGLGLGYALGSAYGGGGYYGGDYYYPSYSYVAPNYYAAAPSSGTVTTSGYYDPNIANIRIAVPADAEVFFDGKKTNQTGAVRVFSTPALTPGDNYSYDVRVRWTDANGKMQEKERHVAVHAGDNLSLNFMPNNL
jgi:uncharacterized protein (TIGR03000 family)